MAEGDNADRPGGGSEDEFRDMLRQFLSGNGPIDPSQLAGAAGLPNDPVALQNLLSQLQSAMQQSGGGINWSLALEQAKQLARAESVPVTDAVRAPLDGAFGVAALWLDEVAYVSELSRPPRTISRLEWISLTMPVWTQLAEPVALSISDALTGVMRDQAPEEMKAMIAGAEDMMRGIGGTLFALQLGQVVGQLAAEVVSGGDIGIPLLEENDAAILPQNVAAFGEGLDIPIDQVQIYLAVRELAHARLFRHGKWVRLALISQITDFARGITIDTTRLEELAENFDPSNPEELRDAMTSGALIPPKTEEQLAAHGRLETMLALIEGWVDVVTAAATTRLPSAGAIAETVRRRRASGGPAESAFATLVGLELRPRRLREAAAMWQAVTDAVGPEARDALWSHPDVLPGSDDLDDPTALVARLSAEARGETPEPDEMDRALEELLNGTTPAAPEGEEPEAGTDGGRPDDDGTAPTGDRPV
ncbi:putative hydrolase [Rathayibacter sp. PhB152]|jgi:putative hydrolase|uniref:zinc-dependent metalloprotease n=1 Tax=unclassified Rathayibacter TaxID=2609250 RepID=UPI000F4B8D30|nr:MULTISPECIES: zinc-dependent metalloprotease [unclassified Rathayibacter]ROQ54587.1 putative hydrolase [Rathayibacter sp. PhB152]ROS25152.1 putative hydrolase [Rathayibacter sp. PhB127]TDX76625.1 putative hydrolase [Rathayibacter sp. PhB151]